MTNGATLQDTEKDFYQPEGRDEEYSDSNDYYTGLTTEQMLDVDNIAEYLSDSQLNMLADDVLRDLKIDKDSRKHREESMNKAMKFALQISEPKNFPWPKASNIIYPLIATVAMRFNARAYAAIINSNEVCKGEVVGKDEGFPHIDPGTGKPLTDKNPETGEPRVLYSVPPNDKKRKAERVAAFINYQLTKEEEEWEEDTDKMLMAMPVVGSMYRKRYFDPILGRTASKLIYPTNFIVNYNASSLKLAPRLSERFELYQYEIEERIRAELYLDQEYKDSGGTELSADYASYTEEENIGTSEDEDSPNEFIEQHRRIDLDGDGYEEPHIVIIHKASRKIARIVANYREDSISYSNNIIIRITSEETYIPYHMIPAPDGGIYSMGLGEILYPINCSINSLINQLMDAGTLSNTSGGFIGRGIRIKAGSVSLSMGEYKKVDSSGANLRDQIYERPQTLPSPVLFQLLGVLLEAGKEIGGMKDVLAGENTANTAAITSLSMIEQALTDFKSIYKRIYRSINKELKIQYRLNSQYIIEEEYQKVLDDPAADAIKDFDSNSTDIIPVNSTGDITDTQKLTKSQILYDLKDDPLMNGVEIRRRILDSANIEGSDELVIEPVPQEDPLTELTAMQLENERLKIENEKYKADITAEKAKAEIGKLNAQTIESMAKAETMHVKAEVDILRASLEIDKSNKEEAVDKLNEIESDYESRSIQLEEQNKTLESQLSKMQENIGIENSIQNVSKDIVDAIEKSKSGNKVIEISRSEDGKRLRGVLEDK